MTDDPSEPTPDANAPAFPVLKPEIRETPRRLCWAWVSLYLALAVIAGYWIVFVWTESGFSAVYTLLRQMLIGGAVGYVTNWLALKMLFKPKREYRFGPWWFFPNHIPAGLIVTRQPDVARVIGEFSREHLLTEQAILEHIKSAGSPGVISDWLFEKSKIWRDLATPYAKQFSEHLSSRQFRKWLANWVDCQIRRYSSQKLREFIGVDDRRRVATALAELATKEFGGAHGRAIIRSIIGDFFDNLESGKNSELLVRTWRHVKKSLPGLVSEHADVISSYLSQPVVAESLMRTLSDEIEKGMRAALSQTILPIELLIQSLSLDNAVAEYIRNNWEKWLLQLTYVIRERKDEIADAAYVRGEAWLHETLSKEKINELREIIVLEGTQVLTGRMDEFLASPETIEVLASTLDNLCSQSLDELCPVLVDEAIERITHKLEELFDSLLDEDNEHNRLFGIAEQASLTVLSEEFSSWAMLSESDRRRICDRIANFVDGMLRQYIPLALEKINLGKMVEHQIGKFSPKEIEDVAIKTANTEMRYIEVIGGIAGAVTAGVLHMVSAMLR